MRPMRARPSPRIPKTLTDKGAARRAEQIFYLLAIQAVRAALLGSR